MIYKKGLLALCIIFQTVIVFGLEEKESRGWAFGYQIGSKLDFKDPNIINCTKNKVKYSCQVKYRTAEYSRYFVEASLKSNTITTIFAGSVYETENQCARALKYKKRDIQGKHLLFFDGPVLEFSKTRKVTLNCIHRGKKQYLLSFILEDKKMENLAIEEDDYEDITGAFGIKMGEHLKDVPFKFKQDQQLSSSFSNTFNFEIKDSPFDQGYFSTTKISKTIISVFASKSFITLAACEDKLIQVKSFLSDKYGPFTNTNTIQPQNSTGWIRVMCQPEKYNVFLALYYNDLKFKQLADKESKIFVQRETDKLKNSGL